MTLCEVIAEVPFVYLRLARRVQQRLIGDVLLSSEFIGSEDQRVRQAVAKAICSCVATMVREGTHFGTALIYAV